MSGIKTNEVKTGGGNLPKSFGPGNHLLKINNISIRVPGFVKKGDPVQYELVLDMETKPLGNGFEGWALDKENLEGAKSKGQTGRIKSRKWPYKNGTWNNPKTGKVTKFSYIDDILQFIQMIEDEAGTTFLKDTSGQFETIVEIVKAFNNEKRFENIYFMYCIGADSEMKEDGHPKYYLHLPKFTKGKKLFASEENAEDVLTYDAALHLLSKDGPTTVQSFKGESAVGEETAPPWDNKTAEATDDPFASEDDGSDPFGEDDDLEF